MCGVQTQTSRRVSDSLMDVLPLWSSTVLQEKHISELLTCSFITKNTHTCSTTENSNNKHSVSEQLTPLTNWMFHILVFEIFMFSEGTNEL